jgi:hypothetical protein
LRSFLTRTEPPFDRVLLIESGSRRLVERAIETIYASREPGSVIDVVTCFAGSPAGLREESTVFRVADYRGPSGRARLFRDLHRLRHTAGGIVCSAEPVMTKWKWWAVARLPVKFFVVNENGDWFWIDRGHWRVIVHFVLFRAGLAGGDAVGSIGRFLAFPFMFIYLVAFAAWIHVRRIVRLWSRRESHG